MFIVNERDEPGKKIFLKMIREKHCKECQVEVKHCDKSKEKWWYLLVLDRVEEVEFYMGCEMLPAELQKGSEADARQCLMGLVSRCVDGKVRKLLTSFLDNRYGEYIDTLLKDRRKGEISTIRIGYSELSTPQWLTEFMEERGI